MCILFVERKYICIISFGNNTNVLHYRHIHYNIYMQSRKNVNDYSLRWWWFEICPSRVLSLHSKICIIIFQINFCHQKTEILYLNACSLICLFTKSWNKLKLSQISIYTLIFICIKPIELFAMTFSKQNHWDFMQKNNTSNYWIIKAVRNTRYQLQGPFKFFNPECFHWKFNGRPSYFQKTNHNLLLFLYIYMKIFTCTHKLKICQFMDLWLHSKDSCHVYEYGNDLLNKDHYYLLPWRDIK